MKKINKYKVDNDLKLLFYSNLIILIFVIVLNTIGITKTDIYKKIINRRNVVYSNVSNYILSYKTRFNKDYNDLVRENELLKQNDNYVKSIEIYNQTLEEEVTSLNKELNLYNNTTYNIINSKCISRMLDSFNDTIIIDKGKDYNININDVVTSNGGLIGIVKDIYYNTAKVDLITAQDAKNISVTVGDNEQLQGIITEFNLGLLKIEGLNNYDNIVLGSTVKTSGLGNLPKGINIAVVSNVSYNDYLTSKVIYAKPLANFNNISYVSVVEKEK